MKVSNEQIVDLKKDPLKREELNKNDVIDRKNDKTNIDKNSDDIIRWEAKEFAYRPKTAEWFVFLTASFVIIEIYFLWSRSFFAFATFLLIFFVVFLYSVKKPEVLRIELNYEGIAVNDKLYKFDEFQSFWIFYNPPDIKKMFLRRKSMLGLFLNIPIGEQDPAILRNFLQNYLPEIQEEELFIDALARKIGF